MNIGGGFQQQQNPLAMAISQQNMGIAQQSQLSEEEKRRRQQALWDALESGWNQMHHSNFNKYSLAGAQAGNTGAYGVSDYM